MSDLTLGEQQFLQRLSSRPCIIEEDAKKMYESTVMAQEDDDVIRKNMADSIGRINRHLDSLGMVVKMVRFCLFLAGSSYIMCTMLALAEIPI
mmetsp:Transcript_40209/g.94538  ORF Transcript_40209/g.94538 Transcript_40209/m.94538 type:complete len:93 (+) Transcript_40209:206-484(+)